jgi:hypothetical protein
MELERELSELVEPMSPESRARVLAAMRATPLEAKVSWTRRFRLVAAAGLAFSAVVVGATIASAHSLPGTAGYPIRGVEERVRLALAIDAEDKVHLVKELARARVVDARHASSDQAKILITDALDEIEDVEREQGVGPNHEILAQEARDIVEARDHDSGTNQGTPPAPAPGPGAPSPAPTPTDSPEPSSTASPGHTSEASPSEEAAPSPEPGGAPEPSPTAE